MNACREIKGIANFGDVVYQKNAGAKNKLFIIGVLHKDPVMGEIREKGIISQIEAYKIGEDLIKNEAVQTIIGESWTSDVDAHEKLPTMLSEEKTK